jgi:hypothetical protein
MKKENSFVGFFTSTKDKYSEGFQAIDRFKTNPCSAHSTLNLFVDQILTIDRGLNLPRCSSVLRLHRLKLLFHAVILYNLHEKYEQIRERK